MGPQIGPKMGPAVGLQTETEGRLARILGNRKQHQVESRGGTKRHLLAESIDGDVLLDFPSLSSSAMLLPPTGCPLASNRITCGRYAGAWKQVPANIIDKRIVPLDQRTSWHGRRPRLLRSCRIVLIGLHCRCSSSRLRSRSSSKEAAALQDRSSLMEGFDMMASACREKVLMIFQRPRIKLHRSPIFGTVRPTPRDISLSTLSGARIRTPNRGHKSMVF